MKKYLKNVSILCMLSLMFFACKKDEVQTVLRPGKAPELSLTSPANVTLLKENASDSTIVFKWTRPDFGYAAGAAYTLQFATEGKNFSKFKTAPATRDLSQILTVGQLNNIMVQLRLKPEAARNVEVRLASTVAGAGGTIYSTIYSNVVKMTVTSYADPVVYPGIYVPGAHQGWNPATAPKLNSIKGDNKYEGYVYFPSPGDFKFTPARTWTVSYGAGTSPGTIAGGANPPNFNMPNSGYHLIKADLNAMTWSAEKREVSIVGSAVGGSPVVMTYNSSTGTLVNEVQLSAGDLMFYVNGGTIKYGTGEDESVLTVNGGPIPITVAGTYEVIADFNDPDAYIYYITKK